MNQIHRLRHLTVGIIALVLVFSGLVATAPSALAEETECRGSIGARSLDKVRVPSGSSCTLNGTSLKGTLKVEGGATLVANGIRVNGNIQA